MLYSPKQDTESTSNFLLNAVNICKQWLKYKLSLKTAMYSIQGITSILVKIST